MLFSGILLTILGFFLVSASPVRAIVDPLEYDNNKFGIHIIDQSDYQGAEDLVNSSGGEWGYVTLVIREDQRNRDDWQRQFDELRRRKLIPLVRLATRLENNAWIAPRKEDINPWVDFLDSLNWVTQNRYIILFNEPNHAKEWGGEIDPEGYAEIIRLYQQALTSKSRDFFVMPAGLDLSASNTSDTMHPANFYEQMYEYDPEIFSIFDGWANHSYPNPGFSGSPNDQGRNTIRGYLWEQELLKGYGLPENIPLAITETGWVHNQSPSSKSRSLSPNRISLYMTQAFQEVWVEDNIFAITPFLLNYRAEPFEDFSWISSVTNEPLAHYEKVKSLEKTKGQPAQYFNSRLAKKYFPEELIAGSSVSVAIHYENTGQSIWYPENTKIVVLNQADNSVLSSNPVKETEPFNLSKTWVEIKPETPGETLNVSIQLEHLGQPFGEQTTYSVEISAESNWRARIRLWFQKLTHKDDLLVMVNNRIKRIGTTVQSFIGKIFA